MGNTTAMLIGTGMQTAGTLLLTIQIWGRAWGFDTSFGLIDEKGRWRFLIRLGLALYIFGYVPIFLATAP